MFVKKQVYNKYLVMGLLVKRWSKESKKSWAVPQVMDGGGVRVGARDRTNRALSAER